MAPLVGFLFHLKELSDDHIAVLIGNGELATLAFRHVNRIVLEGGTIT